MSVGSSEITARASQAPGDRAALFTPSERGCLGKVGKSPALAVQYTLVQGSLYDGSRELRVLHLKTALMGTTRASRALDGKAMLCTEFIIFIGPIETSLVRECLEIVGESTAGAVEYTLVQHALRMIVRENCERHEKTALSARNCSCIASALLERSAFNCVYHFRRSH